MGFAEVGDSDRANAPVAECPLERLVGLHRRVEVGRHRMVEQEEVDIVHPEAPQTAIEPDQCLLKPVVADPQLRRDEHLEAVDAGASDALADLVLVAVGSRDVDQAVPARDRRFDSGGGLLGRALEDAEAENRHLDAVVQGDRRRGGRHLINGRSSAPGPPRSGGPGR